MTDTLDLSSMSLDEKRRLARTLLMQKTGAAALAPYEPPPLPAYADMTYDLAMNSMSVEHAESQRFAEWRRAMLDDGAYSFEAARLCAQRSTVDIRRENGEELRLLNFGSYNYLGYSYHPAVIDAAKEALDRYGLGAASSPILSGTLAIHTRVERALLDYIGLPGRGVSLFSSGFAANTGSISAFLKHGHYAVLDRSVHVSIQEGAQIAKAKIFYFHHNDPDNLEQVLRNIAPQRTRTLVCVEGVYSADGDFGKLAPIVEVAKRYGAKVLVDEAHSFLVAGARGRGVAEQEGVLDAVDMIVVTFSKAFGAVGGALIAGEDLARYVNWYARCRMFSCALDPAVAGGVAKVLELAGGADGDERRKRIRANAAALRAALASHVDIGRSESWVVPVFYRWGKLTFPLNDYLQRLGLDTSIMQFPAVPKDEARIRMFVTSEHEPAHIAKAAAIILEGARAFQFGRPA